jgi:hypothetical protein
MTNSTDEKASTAFKVQQMWNLGSIAEMMN